MQIPCSRCGAVGDLNTGAFCSGCGQALHQAPGMTEIHTDPDQGKVLSIVAICFAGAGVAVFPLLGLVGLVLGIVTLSNGTRPGSAWRVLAIVSIVIGGVLALVTIAGALFFWSLFGEF